MSMETSQQEADVPAENLKASDKVEQALAKLLSTGQLKPGSKMPTERALADELRVPRSAVRTALSRLETQGRVLRIIGSGTYVSKQEPGASLQPPGRGSQDASPLEIMETRMLVEPPLAALVVAHANGADIERIRHAMREAEAAADFETFEVWDGNFHQALADATHNRLMVEVYRTITTARELAEWGELKRKSITPERRATYEHEHREIVNALQARDAVRAQQALEQHLLSVRRNLIGF
jgi:DNA-binding FadR family transcriptional regulator